MTRSSRRRLGWVGVAFTALPILALLVTLAFAQPSPDRELFRYAVAHLQKVKFEGPTPECNRTFHADRVGTNSVRAIYVFRDSEGKDVRIAVPPRRAQPSAQTGE